MKINSPQPNIYLQLSVPTLCLHLQLSVQCSVYISNLPTQALFTSPIFQPKLCLRLPSSNPSSVYVSHLPTQPLFTSPIFHTFVCLHCLTMYPILRTFLPCDLQCDITRSPSVHARTDLPSYLIEYKFPDSASNLPCTMYFPMHCSRRRYVVPPLCKSPIFPDICRVIYYV